MAALRDDLKALQRRLSRDAGGAAPLSLTPSRIRSPWLLGGTLGRVLGRWRAPMRGLARAEAAPERQQALSRPSWGRDAVLPLQELSDPGRVLRVLWQAGSSPGWASPGPGRAPFRLLPCVGQNPDPQRVDGVAASLVLQNFARTEDRFRVNAQLLSAATGEIQWSEKIDIPGADLITVQDQVAERVIAGLRLGLSPEEQARIEELPTRSNEAYEVYLKGRDELFIVSSTGTLGTINVPRGGGAGPRLRREADSAAGAPSTTPRTTAVYHTLGALARHASGVPELPGRLCKVYVPACGTGPGGGGVGTGTPNAG
jgi:hypothetical protein